MGGEGGRGGGEVIWGGALSGRGGSREGGSGLVKRELWETLKGEKVEGNARFKGVSGVMFFEKYGKKVELEVPDYSFDVLVYPMDVEGDEGGGG